MLNMTTIAAILHLPHSTAGNTVTIFPCHIYPEREFNRSP